MRVHSKSVTLTITRRTLTWGRKSVVFYHHGKDVACGRGCVLASIGRALKRAGI